MRHCSAALVSALACVLGALPTCAEKFDLGKIKPQHIAQKVVKTGKGLASSLPEGSSQSAAKAIQQSQGIAKEGAKKLAEVASSAADLGKDSTNTTAVGVETGKDGPTSAVDTPPADTSGRTSADENGTKQNDMVEAVAQGLQGAKDAIESSSEIKKAGKQIAAAMGLPKPKVKDALESGHQGVQNIIKKAAPGVTEVLQPPPVPRALKKPTPAEGVKHLLNESGEVLDTVKKEGQGVKDAVETKVKEVLKSPEQVKEVLKTPSEQAKEVLKQPAEQAQQALKKVDSKVADTIEKAAPGVTEALKKPTGDVQQLIKNTNPETVDTIKKATPSATPTKALPSAAPGDTATGGASWQWTVLGMFVAAAALVCGWYLFGRIKGREGRSPTLLVESEMSPWNLSGGQQVRGRPIAEEPLFRQF